MSTPPPVEVERLSNSISRNLLSIIGSIKQPDPFPPVKERENIPLISKSCGSTYTSFTLPEIIGSTRAVDPVPADISIFGGFMIS